MAIQTIAGFNIGGTDPVDTRLVLTTEDMLSEKTRDSVMPNNYFAINSNYNKIYVYDKSNEFKQITDEAVIPKEIGKWRLYEGGSSSLEVIYHEDIKDLEFI